MAAILAAGPVVRIVVPIEPAVVIVTLPEQLAADLRRRYAEMDAEHERMGFKRFTFGEWVNEIFKDAVYGAGHPWPEERR